MTHPLWLWASLAVVAVMKVWLVSAQTLFTNYGSANDERLFLYLADYLLNGQWLGPYNQSTLVKGMFYPLWIAATHALGVPLLLSQHLLYIASCSVLMLAIGPLVRHRAFVALVFVMVLFNPMSFTENVMTTTLREGVYPSLSLLVLGCTIGFFVRRDKPLRELIPWLAGLGLALSAFWLTREEGVWLIPFLLFVFGAAYLKMATMTPREWGRIFLGVIPFAVWLIALGIVAGMNKIHYGIFATSECRAPDFLAAYGALCRVKPARWQPTIPVPYETRERIYRISPAFAELKPFLESVLGQKAVAATQKVFLERYAKDADLRETVNRHLRLHLGADSSDLWVQKWYNGTLLSGEALGGDFLWPLRNAAADAGHHSSGLSASKYYRRLAAEINAACSDGRLACDAERATMRPPWHAAYTGPLISALFSSTGFLVTYENFSPRSKPSVGHAEFLDFARKITRDRLLPSEICITGWAFTPEAPVSLSVSSANGKPRKAAATLGQESDDVYRYFLAQGMDLPHAAHSRFELSTDCTAGCYLDIKAGDILAGRLPLDGGTPSLNTPGLRAQLEKVAYRNASPHAVMTDAFKTGILESVGRAYQVAMPILSAAALIAYILCTLQLFRNPALSLPWIVNTGLLVAIVSRLTVVAFVHVSSFPAISTRYLAPVYALVPMFVALALYTGFGASPAKEVHTPVSS